MTPVGLRVRDLTVRLGGVEVLHGVDLVAGAGEMVGIVGPNGAGKTTVLRAIVGSVRAAGRIELGGRPVEAMSRTERARTAALVPQRPVLPPGMRVVDYALLGRTPHLGLLQSESAHDVAIARASLATLDVEVLAERDVTSLSGGEAQRVVIARALTQGSPLLLLDEPTSSLDVGHAQRVLGLVDEMRRDSGSTVVAAIHDLTLAAQFCDRLVMLSGGSVVAHGRPVTVLTESTILDHYGATVRVLDEGDGRVVVIPTRHANLEPPTAMEQT